MGYRPGTGDPGGEKVQKKLSFCRVECLGELLVLGRGVGVLAGLPVDVLVVAGAVHGVDLGVDVYKRQEESVTSV